MRSSPSRRIVSVAVTLLAFGLAPSGSPRAVGVVLRVVDPEGFDIPARVHVRDGSGAYFPGYPDSALFGHQHWPWMGGYFYYQGQPVSMDLAPGTARIEVSKGPEWMPARLYPAIHMDTTIVVTLTRVFDMSAHGWFSGDSHVHTNHTPVDYPVRPAAALRIAQAEDLNVMWILDQSSNFTGGPHHLSTQTTILYYTYEYRDQACGHAELLGAKTPMSWGCCMPPNPASPFLSEYREAWNPGWDEAMVLAHPETGADYFHDTGWPGWGLGREFPLLATSGSLDAYAVASYSNSRDLSLLPWYSALSCGYMIPPSAGTDAMCCRYWSRPPGGYRVYVKEPCGHHCASKWVAGLKAGRVFITNLPLITLFEVNGMGPGEMLELEASPATVTVQYRIDSTLPVSTLEIIHNGGIAASIPLWPMHGQQTWEGTHDLCLETGGWIAGRVRGATDRMVVVSPELFAHTGAVGVRIDGALPVNSAAAGFLYDKADSLEMFVETRGGWQSEAQRQEALARIQDARDRLARHFTVPPSSFHLLSPADGDTVSCEAFTCLQWEDAIDPEDGDRVQYLVTISPDPDFGFAFDPVPVKVCEVDLSLFDLAADRRYWWRVTVCDRGGNCTPCHECHFSFFLCSQVSSVAESQPGFEPRAGGSQDPPDRGGYSTEGMSEPVCAMRTRMSIRPNPSFGQVWIALYNSGLQESGRALEYRTGVFDLQGRCLRSLEHSSGELFWDGADDLGRRVPSGVYWIRSTGIAAGSSYAEDTGGQSQHMETLTARLQIVR